MSPYPPIPVGPEGEERRDCLTCARHDPTIPLNKKGAICWSCSSNVSLPMWRPKEPPLTDPRPSAASEQPAEQGSTQNPWAIQEGGAHYKDMPIQPLEFSLVNRLDPMQHTVIKYVTRFRSKNGIADLRKARHTIDLLIAHEQNQASGKRTA